MKLQTQDWKRSVSGVRRDATSIKSGLRDLGKAGAQAAKDLRMVAIGLSAAVGLAAKSFIGAASEAENYRVRLEGLLGSTQEGSRMFREMADYAARVPFQYREVMAAATQLSGIMDGGVDQIKAWMPLIGDLAAAAGLDLETTTGQIMRMFSAGAASADLFRERGILAMLGFQSGVQYSAAETRERLIQAWTDPESKFRDMTVALGETWQGQLGMMSDKWFKLRTAIMDSGPFDALKDKVKSLNEFLDRHMGTIEKWINAHGDLVVAIGGSVAALTGMLATLTTLGFILPPLATALKSLGNVALVAWTKLLIPAAPFLAAAGAVVAGLALIGAEVYAVRAAWNQNFGGIRDATQRWINLTLSMFEVLYRGIVKTFNEIGLAWGRLLDSAFGAAKTFGNTVIGHFVGIGKAVKTALDWNAPGGLGNFFAPVEAYKSALGVDYLGGLTKGLGYFRDHIIQVAEETINLGKVTVEALGYWWDFAKDANIQEWGRVLRDQVGQDFDAVMGYIAEKYPTLAHAIGGMFGDAITDEVKGALEVDVAAMLDDIQAAGATGGGGAAGKAGKAAAQVALQNEADKLLEDRLRRANELFADMQPKYVQAMDDMIAKMQLLRETGLLDDALEQNLLAPYFWEEWGSLGVDQLDAVLASFSQISPETNEIVQQMWAMRDSGTEMAKEWNATSQNIQTVGYRINQIADSMGNNVVKRIGAAVNQTMALVDMLKETQAAFKELKDRSEDSETSVVQSLAKMGSGALGAVGAVLGLADAFGLLGEKTEEVKTGWSRMMEELEDKLDEWADRLTDTIIEFVKTGEFELEKFVQSVLEDTLRVTIRYGMIDPLLGGLLGNAQGNAFDNGRLLKYAKGGILNEPRFFPLKDGKTGMAGEAGPEAILPLRRTSSGDLGVIAQAGGDKGLTVNIIDQRSGDTPPVKVDRLRRNDGSEELRILIEDVVNQGLMNGAFDNTGSLAYGWARGR